MNFVIIADFMYVAMSVFVLIIRIYFQIAQNFKTDVNILMKITSGFVCKSVSNSLSS